MDVLGLVPFFVGVALLVFGLVSVSIYYGQATPPTIGGNEVMAAYQCTQGYAVGSCPILSDSWSGTLVDPSPHLIGGLGDIWKLQGASADTCGLPATYLLNLPLTSPNGTQSQVGGTNEPAYVPLGSQVKGIITYGNLVYAYTSSTYNIADGCGGNDLASVVGTAVQGTITYTSSGTRTLVLGTGATYSFSGVNEYMASLLAGGFLSVGGFLWAFGQTLGIWRQERPARIVSSPTVAPESEDGVPGHDPS